MKHLMQLESWADTIISEATAPQTTGERPLPIQKDILYKATQKYPGYTQDQALTLWVADQMAERQQTDLDQNKLINAQRRENDKLRNDVAEIGNELEQHERTALDTDREVRRLRDLSAKLRPSSEITQQAAKISADELQRLTQKVDTLQGKPGLEDKEFRQLKDKVKAIASMKGVTVDDVSSISKELDKLNRENEITQAEYEKVVGSLNAKEARFKKYIEKKGAELTGQARQHAEEIKHYADIVDQYKDKITAFKNDMDRGRQDFAKELNIIRDLRGNLQQELEQVQGQSDEVQKAIAFIKQAAGAPQAQAAISKAQSSSRQDQAQAQQEPEQAYGKRLLPGMNLAMNEETKMFLDDVNISRYWQDPDFTEWMRKHLGVLVQMFKRNYKLELEKKRKGFGYPYSDKQIAYVIENNAWWIDNWFKKHEDSPLTKEAMDAFMAAVRLELFENPPEPETGELFNESVYEDMLDSIIESCFTKNTSKK